MPIQFNYDDEFKRNNPAAFAVVETGSWTKGAGGVSVQTSIYADKAAYIAGGKPLFAFSKFITMNTDSLLNAVEQALLQDALIAPGSPSQVSE